MLEEILAMARQLFGFQLTLAEWIGVAMIGTGPAARQRVRALTATLTP